VRLRAYRLEWLVLVLAALGTLPLVGVLGAQDTSRLALTQSIVERGKVDIDPYWQLTIDRGFAHGHWYSDKAPGVSLTAVPAAAVVRAVEGAKPVWTHSWPLWALRVWSGGVALLALTFLVGRVGEGLVAGAGALTAATLAVGTMAGSLGPTVFGHLPDALALFAALILGSRGHWVCAGLLAGVGVLFEYPAGLAALVLLIYAGLRGGRRSAGAFVAGAVPPALLLGAYDWLAFGAPWRLSYRYTSNIFTSQQRQNLFGIGLPTGHGIWTLLLDGHGLLLVSPVLLISIAGLVLFRRRYRFEATAASVIALVFAVYTAGYFLPNGGLSPGPRFATGALPFLLLGLPFALARWRVVTLVLAAFSIGVALFDELTWSVTNKLQFKAWPETAWSLAGLSRESGALLMLACGAAAGLVAVLSGRGATVRGV
jgi:uncharacterized membrane protein